MNAVSHPGARTRKQRETPGAAGSRIGRVRTARNIAIIALAALVIAAVPGGEETAETISVAISMAFFAAIAWFAYTLYRSRRMTLLAMGDGRRAILFGAVGAIALLIVGFEEFRAFSGGVLLWIALMGAAVAAIFLVWREANTLS